MYATGTTGTLITETLLLFTWAAVYGLSDLTDLPLWASFLIVGGFYLLVAVILALAGASALKKARGPEKAVAEMQRTKEIVQSIPPNSSPSSNGATAAVSNTTSGAAAKESAPRP